MSGTYPPGWGSGSGESGAAADAARAKTSASAKKKKPASGQPDQPGEAEAKLRAAGVSEADIARGYSSGGSGGSSRPGQPDQPGEAEAKMITAGVMAPGGEMKQIVGYYKDPQTGIFKFAAKGEPLPRVPVPKPAETKQMQQAAALRAAQQPQQPVGLIPQFDERTIRPEYTSGTAYQYDQPYLRDPTIIDISLRRLKEADVAVSKRLPLQPDPFTTYTQFWSDIGKPIRERYDTGKMPVPVSGGMELVRGASEIVWDKPVTTAGTAAAFYFAAPIIAGATGVVGGLPVVGAHAPAITKLALTGMGGLYAYGAGKRIIAPEETDIMTVHEGVPSLTGEPGWLTTTEHVSRKKTFPEMMHTAGEIIGGEIIPMGLGARLYAHPPPVPKVTAQAGGYRLDVGRVSIAASPGKPISFFGDQLPRTPAIRLQYGTTVFKRGGKAYHYKEPIDWTAASYRGIKLAQTPEVIALKAKARAIEGIGAPEPPMVFPRPIAVEPITSRPTDPNLIFGRGQQMPRTPVSPPPAAPPLVRRVFGWGEPSPIRQPRPVAGRSLVYGEKLDLHKFVDSAKKAKQRADARMAEATQQRVPEWRPKVYRHPSGVVQYADPAAIAKQKLTASVPKGRARKDPFPERTAHREAADARKAKYREIERSRKAILAKQRESVIGTPDVAQLSQKKFGKVAAASTRADMAQTTVADLYGAPLQVTRAARKAARDLRARPAPPRQRVGGRQKLSPAMMQLMQTSQVQRISQVQAQYQPPTMSQAYKQLSAQEITQAQAQDQQQIVVPIFGQAQAQRTAQTQKQFQTQRLKTQMQTPVRHKMPPVTPRTGKKEIPPEPKPKPFALPTLKDTKAKRRIPRKKLSEAEHWQIRNPIASIQQMIAGRLQQLRLPK